jgi:hypothetical protein
MNIDKALEEINDHRERLNRIELFLKQNAEKFEGENIKSPASLSLNLTLPTIYIWAGLSPSGTAKKFGGTCSVSSDSWYMDFQDFHLCFMEAAEAQTVVL